MTRLEVMFYETIINCLPKIIEQNQEIIELLKEKEQKENE